ncbi:MAG: GntR family transcriptional regulator [Geminicoccaceae bacterium]
MQKPSGIDSSAAWTDPSSGGQSANESPKQPSRSAAERGRSDGPNEEEIVERVFEAVIDQRLPPGTKLSEQSLCEAFGVGRMRVRRSLLLLASRDIVELHSNRGAYIGKPTVEQAREVFQARRVIEPDVARLAAIKSGEADLARLSTHLLDEQQAHKTGNRQDAIRLSGLFHVLLAETAGNGVLARMVKELVTRTSLIIGMFGSSGTTNCLDDEHDQILQAVSAREGDRAARLMAAHLDDIEAKVDLSRFGRPEVDIVALFRSG